MTDYDSYQEAGASQAYGGTGGADAPGFNGNQQAGQEQAYTGAAGPYGYEAGFQPYSAQAYPQPKPVLPERRVGTFSMGASLVAVGGMLVYHLFNPAFNLVAAAKFMPLVLVLFGLEVLFNAMFVHNRKLKYDFLSGLVCVLLIAVSTGVSLIGPAYEYWGPNRYKTETRLTREIEDLYFNRLKEMSGSIVDGSVYVGLRGDQFRLEMTPEDLSKGDDISLNLSIRLPEGKNDKKSFAESCQKILSYMSGVNPQPNWIYIETGDGKYDVRLDGVFQLNMDAAEIEKMVSVLDDEEVYFDDEDVVGIPEEDMEDMDGLEVPMDPDEY